jgi:orotate phosphoribosyltransferase
VSEAGPGAAAARWSADPRRVELHRILGERAFRWGDFVLASGRRSDYFFDAKQVTLDGPGLRLTASLLLDRCRELGVTAVAGDDGVGPLLGALVALSAGGEGPPLRAFMIRKADKQHGTAAKIAGPPPQPGERVVLVEDVATTGASVLRALEALAPTGVSVVEAAVIVDREEGGAAALAERGLALFSLFRRSDFRREAAGV